MTRIYLLDAHGLAVTFYHATKPSKNEPGDLISAVRDWWIELQASMSPTHVVACFDTKRETNWRYKLHVEYKANRVAKPKEPELVEQLAQLPTLFKDLGIATSHVDGYEADDLIATMANDFDEAEIVIVSSDKDQMQLVSDRVMQLDPKKNKAGEWVLYDEAKVTEKFGFPPHRIREYLALVGDSSDNVPGVKGWGDTTAKRAIQQTKSKAEMLRRIVSRELDDITAARFDAFNPADFALSYELVGLRFDVPHGLTIDSIAVKQSTREAA